jgi:long-chain fatty acid transport protein
MKTKNSRKVRLTIPVLAFATISAVNANNGDQMVGYSAIGNAMGGAVVATPHDVSTSLSNPAGLAYLNLGETGTRFDMNLSLLNPHRELNDVKSDNEYYVMATGGFAFQSETFENFTIGIGAYPISGGGVDFPAEAYSTPLTGSSSIVASRQSLRIGPAAAYRIHEGWSIGANLSLAVNQMSLKSPIRNFPVDVAYGVSGVIGTVYDVSERVRIGAAYTTRSYSQDLEWNLDDGKYRMSFEDPQQVALGISIAATDRLHWELDVKWLNFSGVRDEVKLRTPDGQPDQILAFGWDDQTVVAIGARYRATDSLSWLAGYNYGASPVDETNVNQNIGVTAIVEHHWSIGAIYSATKNTTLTASLIHGVNNTLTASEGPPTKVSFETNLVTLQFTYTH